MQVLHAKKYYITIILHYIHTYIIRKYKLHPISIFIFTHFMNLKIFRIYQRSFENL